MDKNFTTLLRKDWKRIIWNNDFDIDDFFLRFK